MGRRATFQSDQKSLDLENRPTGNGTQADQGLPPKDSENHFVLAKAIAKWVLISIAVMMALGYLIEALDSKVLSILVTVPRWH